MDDVGTGSEGLVDIPQICPPTQERGTGGEDRGETAGGASRSGQLDQGCKGGARDPNQSRDYYERALEHQPTTTLFVEFAKFEVQQGEVERARAIYKLGLDYFKRTMTVYPLQDYSTLMLHLRGSMGWSRT